MNGLTLLPAGTVFAGDYRVERPLREGGMGAVYVAEQLSTSRKCALKVMQPEIVQDAGARRRFAREAKIGGQLTSDFVVQVLQAGVDEKTGMPWLAMELLEGEDLEEHVNRRGHLGAAELLEVFDPLCEALGEAHGKGIVHRDLKPENIFLAKPRRKRDRFTVKVLDFGIARLGSEIRTTSSRTQKIMGTPLYMAPEQAQPGTPIGPATDVWALGLIAFRLLTGQFFWRAAYDENASLTMLMMEAYMTDLPSASQRAAERGRADRLPPGFDAWFARCVCRDAKRRYQDAAQAFAALESIAGVPREKAPAAIPETEKAPTATLPIADTETAFGTGTAPMERPPLATTPGGSPRVVDSASGSGGNRLPRWTIGLGAAVIAAGGIGIVAEIRGGKGAGIDPLPPPPPPPPPTHITTAAPAKYDCGPGMVEIPGGAFDMGSDQGADDEKPIHRVPVKTFCMDRTEVTTAAYDACVVSKKCTPAGHTSFCNTGVADRGDHPINCVDWGEAAAYCASQQKRLPTEAEWEFAARGPEGRVYPWGDAAPGLQACWNGKESDVGKGKRPSTCPVGKYPAGNTPLGLADMAGNVWEWTASWYCPYREGAQCDNTARAVRGGSWYIDTARSLRAANRSGYNRTVADSYVGFRCARDLP